MAITLTDEYALLAFDEEAGHYYDRAGAALAYGLAACLIMDLQALGAAHLDDDDKVTATGTAPDDPLLAEAWHSLDAEPGHGLSRWITRERKLVKGLPHSAYEHLAARGVLADEGRTVFRRDRYRELDQQPGRDLVAGLGAVLDGERPPEDGELVLLALLPVSRLTSAVFPERDRHATDKRIKALVADDTQASDVARRVARAIDAQIAVVLGGAAGA